MIEVIAPVFCEFVDESWVLGKNFKMGNVKRHIVTNINIRSSVRQVRILRTVWGSHFRKLGLVILDSEAVDRDGKILYVEIVLGY